MKTNNETHKQMVLIMLKLESKKKLIKKAFSDIVYYNNFELIDFYLKKEEIANIIKDNEQFDDIIDKIFIKAIEYDQIKTIKTLLKYKTNNNFYWYVYMAVQKNNLELAKLFIQDYRVNLSKKNSLILSVAINKNNLEIVKELLKQNKKNIEDDPNELPIVNHSAIIKSIECGNIKIFEYLIKEGKINTNIISMHGNSQKILNILLKSNNPNTIDMLEILIEKRAKLGILKEDFQQTTNDAMLQHIFQNKNMIPMINKLLSYNFICDGFNYNNILENLMEMNMNTQEDLHIDLKKMEYITKLVLQKTNKSSARFRFIADIFYKSWIDNTNNQNNLEYLDDYLDNNKCHLMAKLFLNDEIMGSYINYSNDYIINHAASKGNKLAVFAIYDAYIKHKKPLNNKSKELISILDDQYEKYNTVMHNKIFYPVISKIICDYSMENKNSISEQDVSQKVSSKFKI